MLVGEEAIGEELEEIEDGGAGETTAEEVVTGVEGLAEPGATAIGEGLGALDVAGCGSVEFCLSKALASPPIASSPKAAYKA